MVPSTNLSTTKAPQARTEAGHRRLQIADGVAPAGEHYILCQGGKVMSRSQYRQEFFYRKIVHLYLYLSMFCEIFPRNFLGRFLKKTIKRFFDERNILCFHILLTAC